MATRTGSKSTANTTKTTAASKSTASEKKTSEQPSKPISPKDIDTSVHNRTQRISGEARIR